MKKAFFQTLELFAALLLPTAALAPGLELSQRLGGDLQLRLALRAGLRF